MELIVNLETKEDDVEVPIGDMDSFQVRADGVMLNGKLHFWENILFMSVVNRGELKKVKDELPL